MKDNYVLIQGLGLNQGGVGAARYFAKKGKRVLVTDLKSEEELRPSVEALAGFKNIDFILGQHKEEDFHNAELVISSPAVPLNSRFLRIAKENGVPTYCPMSYFFVHKKGTAIGVTGTRGKSTTTNLIYQILKRAKKQVYLGGNIGRSVLDFLDELNKDSFSVLEISSFMLKWIEYVKISPEIAVLTNVYPDHLNRHKNMVEYIGAKKQIFQYQNDDNIVFLNMGNSRVASLKDEVPGQWKDFSKEEIDFGKLNLDELHPLNGGHNQENIKAAVTVGRYLNIAEDKIKSAIKEYEGLYGRQMYVGEVNGAKIINDTCATIPQAVVAALERFADYPTILLTGGKDKGVSYFPLAKVIKKYQPKAVIMLGGSAAVKLKKEMEKIGWKNFYEVDSLEEGVSQAMKEVESGDVLLFSPGGSSFERFANEFDRGRQFDKLINAS